MIKLKSLFRRGQGGSPSSTSSASSKQTNQNSPAHSVGIKTSASASSLDRIAVVNSGSASADLGATRKLSKTHKQSSKDKLNDLLKGGSKEKLFDDKKELKKLQKQQQKQMQQVAQQAHHPSSSARQSPGEQRPERTKDFDSAALNGMQDVKHKQTMQELRQLQQENSILETKIRELSSSHSEMIQLRKDVQHLQQTNDVHNSKLSQLEQENELLRGRLRTVVQSPLSDNEKQQMIQDAQHRMHSSAPASIALPNFIANNDTDGIPCTTPDWDKHSSSSEVSVACLQDKIIQMEETHYSTNEELQATLQELADLQNQVLELQTDNERLSDEKDVIFQSLCRQTEKLEDTRGQVETLQQLLLRDPDNQQESASSEREQKLVDLLKSAQDEREGLLMKLEELNSDLNELKKSLDSSQASNERLKERISVLESTIDASTADRKEIERELSSAKEEASAKQIEISRLTTLLENARSKIDEFENDRALGDKSDLGELLDIARKEKDYLETEITTLQEQLSKSQNETQRLRDNLAGVTEECKVTRNNAKCALSDLEYKCEQMKQEKQKLQADYQQMSETVGELQVQSKCLLDDKGQLETLLTQTQCHLGDTERMLAEKCDKLENEMTIRRQENEEWEQFQQDLLISVRVANDFKTEAQLAHEQLALDNKLLREKIRGMESQIEKLNKLVASSNESQQSILTTVQQEMAQRRNQKTNGTAVKNGTNGIAAPVPFMTRQDSRLSVKSLIESIENTSKSTKGGSQSGSTSSLNSLTALDQQNDSQSSPSATEQEKQLKTLNNNSLTNNNNLSGSINGSQKNRATTPQKNDDQFYSSILSSHNLSHKHDYVRRNSYGDISERKDPLNALVKNGGSKRNALLKWCQNKTVGYRNIDITNFSSSWNDGLALCALMHSYLPDMIPYDELSQQDKKRNFSLAFSAAERVGINTTLNISEMCQIERPDWQCIMGYVTEIYKHFETQS